MYSMNINCGCKKNPLNAALKGKLHQTGIASLLNPDVVSSSSSDSGKLMVSGCSELVFPLLFDVVARKGFGRYQALQELLTLRPGLMHPIASARKVSLDKLP